MILSLVPCAFVRTASAPSLDLTQGTSWRGSADNEIRSEIQNLCPPLPFIAHTSSGIGAVAKDERAPLCPACGTRMRLSRVTERAYGRYRLRSYECGTCRLSYTEGEPEAERGND